MLKYEQAEDTFAELANTLQRKILIAIENLCSARAGISFNYTRDYALHAYTRLLGGSVSQALMILPPLSLERGTAHSSWVQRSS